MKKKIGMAEKIVTGTAIQDNLSWRRIKMCGAKGYHHGDHSEKKSGKAKHQSYRKIHVLPRGCQNNLSIRQGDMNLSACRRLRTAQSP